MTLLADLLSTVFERRSGATFSRKRDGRAIAELVNALVESRDETSGVALANEVLGRFGAMEDDEKLDFFLHIADVLNIDPETVRASLNLYEAAPSQESYRAFATAAEPRRQELIRRLNQVPGATEALVRMRADLLRIGRGNPALEALDLDFRHLFASWFNRGFLVLRPINWQSPAHILEKIIAYEAVHAIDSWDDLRSRLAPSDRRCFAFFHPSMPDEPLIFVEVALTDGVPGSVQELLAEAREVLPSDSANSAVFYSISNCQPGLAGISFGDSLIKQVASDLSAALPSLKTFVTLSPIPGLVKWLQASGIDHDPADQKALRGLAAHYLTQAKRADGMPMDPVARFHLGNGAIIHAVHAGADTSDKGIEQSAGTMVNYLYNLAKVARNHERFTSGQEVIASSEVRSLASAVSLPAQKGKTT